MRKFLIVVLLSFCLNPSAFANFATPQPSSWTEQPTYGDRIVHKLGFGLLNFSMGWTAIPFQIEKNQDIQIFTGIAKGVFYTITNTVGGALHAVTFPIDADIPLPAGGVQFE